MAGKRDLAEAHAYARRRLVTAFVSGAPGGREVEPSRPARALIGGVALCVLLLAAAAVIGFLKPRHDAGWASRDGLVVAEGSLQLYLVEVDDAEGAEPVLVPVVNATSARLILGSDLDPVTVPQSEIDRYEVEEAVGIPQAPVSTPSADALIDDDWTSCTGDELGVRTSITAEPAVTYAKGQALFVRAEGAMGQEYYLIAPGDPETSDGVQRYAKLPVPAESLNGLLGELRGPGQEAIPEVSSAWVGLLPTATAVDAGAFDFENSVSGQPVAGISDDDGNPIVSGTLVSREGEDVVVSDDGYWPLSPFASAVYASLPGNAPPIAVSGDLGERRAASYPVGEWPTDVPEPLRPSESTEFCAVLQTHTDSAAGVVLAVRPGEGVSAKDVPAGEQVSTVERGRGAVVEVGDFTSTEADDAYLIDSQAIRYPLPEDSLERLGYAMDSARVVPAPWVESFSCGATLTRADALKPLDEQDEGDVGSCDG